MSNAPPRRFLSPCGLCLCLGFQPRDAHGRAGAGPRGVCLLTALVAPPARGDTHASERENGRAPAVRARSSSMLRQGHPPTSRRETEEAVRRPWLLYRHPSRNGFGIFNDCSRLRRCFRRIGCAMSDSDTVCPFRFPEPRPLPTRSPTTYH